MPEQRRFFPETRDQSREISGFESLKRYKEALETAGRRIVAILGPAIAIGSPALAAQHESIKLHPGSEVHCDIAYINQNGEQIGSASITLPDTASLTPQNVTIPTEIRQAGDCSGDRIVGLLTEVQNINNIQRPEDPPSMLDQLKDVARKIQEQGYREHVSGMQSNALGWTFMLNTENLPHLSPYDVNVTTALTVENTYGINKVMTAQLPKTPGAFIELHIKPKS